DILVTGKACANTKQRNTLIEKVLAYPGIENVLAKGENKVSFQLRTRMQVDIRLLAPASFGAALLYFTGSKSHNIELRQRALKMGLTLNEYGLAKLGPKGAAGKVVAAATEEDIYKRLKLDYIEPEMREATGEIEAAEQHTLPRLITGEDLR